MLESLRQWPRGALAAWVVLAVAVVARVAIAPPLSGTVVPIYLKAGERWRAGEDIYAAFWPLDIYRNPPGVAAFFAPWSHLPPKTAGILWRLFGLGVYLAGLTACTRALVARSGHAARAAFALAAAVLIIPSFNNGQVNVLIVGSLLLAAANLSRGALGRAAAWVALASSFKVYPLAVGLLFCVAAPRFALRLLPFGTLAALLPFACQRPDYVAEMHRAFVAFLELEGKYRLMLDRPPWDWTILPRAWLDLRVSGEIAKAISAAAGVSFAVLVAIARRRKPDDALPLAFALGCVWMTLFGPATENATYTLIAPVAAALFLRGGSAGAWVAATLFALPILRGLFPSGDVLPFRTAQPLGALVVLAMLVNDLFDIRRPRATPERTVTAARIGLPGFVPDPSAESARPSDALAAADPPR